MYRIRITPSCELPHPYSWVLSEAEIFAQKARISLPEKLTVEKEPKGKPYFPETDLLHFSLSHSGDYTALVLSDRPVGIDIQKHSFRCSPEAYSSQADKLARRFFCPQEIRYLEEDPSLLLSRFFEIWTKKESYVKRSGTGIGTAFLTLNTFSCDTLFDYCQPFPDYSLTVCLRP